MVWLKKIQKTEVGYEGDLQIFDNMFGCHLRKEGEAHV